MKAARRRRKRFGPVFCFLLPLLPFPFPSLPFMRSSSSVCSRRVEVGMSYVGGRRDASQRWLNVLVSEIPILHPLFLPWTSHPRPYKREGIFNNSLLFFMPNLLFLFPDTFLQPHYPPQPQSTDVLLLCLLKGPRFECKHFKNHHHLRLHPSPSSHNPGLHLFINCQQLHFICSIR